MHKLWITFSLKIQHHLTLVGIREILCFKNTINKNIFPKKAKVKK